MDFPGVLSCCVLFGILLSGSHCVQITIQESYGTKDDGLVQEGSKFSIYCKTPELRPGQFVVWFKSQGDAQRIALGYNDFFLDLTAKERFERKSIYTGADEGEDETEGELIGYIINLKEGVGAHYSDSGNYYCGITTKMDIDEGEEVNLKEASLVVIDPIDSIHLYSVRPEDIDDETKYVEHADGDDVTIQAGDQFFFRCVTKSSNPPAQIRILIGDRDITDKYRREDESVIVVDDEDVSGTTVYHHLAYDVKMTSIDPVRIEREDNKRPVICNASVPDQPPVKISIVPQMLYFPEVECHDNDADYQEKKTHIRCIVRASPKLRWAEFHYNETTATGQNLTHTIKPGESAGQMHFRVEEGKYEDQLVYLLEFNHVPEQSFRRYTFYGGNDIRNVTGTAKLIMNDIGALHDDANIQQAMSLMTVLVISALSILL